MNRSSQEIADAYVAHFRTKSDATEWANDVVQDLTLHKHWEEAWQVVLAIARSENELETEVLAFVAAGPLEDIICKAGPDFIGRMEHEAKRNRTFGRLLTGVWPTRAQPAVREALSSSVAPFQVQSMSNMLSRLRRLTIRSSGRLRGGCGRLLLIATATA